MSNNNKDTLLKFLRSVRNDRGAMANLRCALRESQRHRAWPFLARFGGIGDEHSHLVVQTVAGLYATHPREAATGNFGSTCRNLMDKNELDKLAEGATEVGPIARRFQHLLAAERGKEIAERVIRFGLRMKAADVPVNYGELFDSLWDWSDRAKNCWAGSFWDVSQLEEAAL